jgi:hypothetical protein
MNQTKELILNALEYADTNKEKHVDIVKKARYYSTVISEKDMEPSVITFYDKHKKPFFKARYEMLGTYLSDANTWLWAWADPRLPKSTTYLSKKILNYGLNIDSKENWILKTELITSRFRIFDSVQLDMHIALSSYIAKAPFIYNIYDVLEPPEYVNNVRLTKIHEQTDKEPYNLFVLVLFDYNKSG